jgi:hypothetical protein
VNIGGLPSGAASRGGPFRYAPVSWGATHKEDTMLLNLTSIVLVALALYCLIKLACAIYS